MDTILYLMLEKKNERRGDAFPPFFHIRRMKEDMREDSSLVYVNIPWACLDPWELAGYLVPFLSYSSSVDTVYDKSLEAWLGKRSMAEWWQESWPYPEFRDYYREDYARYLLDKALTLTGKPERIVVLGFEDFVPRLLRGRLRYTKALRFLVDGLFPERKEHGVLEDFLEEVYEEYGLAAACDVVENGMEARRSAAGGTVGNTPLIVLDFAIESSGKPHQSVVPRRRTAGRTGIAEESRNAGGVGIAEESRVADRLGAAEEARVAGGLGAAVWALAAQAAPGSIWLDMGSNERKRRRIEGIGRNISYFSMKKEWERLGRQYPSRMLPAPMRERQ